MNRIYTPTTDAADWQRLLADPIAHWQIGFSARTIAHSWEAADGLPPEVASLFTSSPVFFGESPTLLVAFPEHKVDLPPRGRRASQNDVFALARVLDGLISITVEGKVQESFGPTLADWMIDITPGKAERLQFLKATLGIDLDAEIPDQIRYQFFHRTASALLEATRFHASYAVMIVHAFGEQSDSFNDYIAFVDYLGGTHCDGTLTPITSRNGIRLLLGWAQGNPVYLTH